MSPIVLVLIASLGQPPLSADVEPLPLRGAVVDASGNAVAGADVWIADASSVSEGLRPRVELAWSGRARASAGALPVLVPGRTDESGRFVLSIPAGAVARRSPPALAVWAALKEQGGGWRIGARRLPRIVLADDGPVRIEMGTNDPCSVIVNGPDGKPVDGARVAPVRAFGLPVPEPLAQKLTATTDASGRASIIGMGHDALEAARIESTAYGTQIIQNDMFKIQGPSGPLTLALAPVGRVEGRLVFPQGERMPIHGVKAHVTSYVEGHEGPGRTGEAVVECDEEGRFTVPAIAAGVLIIELEYGAETGPTERAGDIGSRVFRAGQALRFTVSTHATVSVTGLYREQGTKRPIAGVKVGLNTASISYHDAITDARGEFHARLTRGRDRLLGSLLSAPAPFLVRNNTGRISLHPPANLDAWNLPPTELERGVDLAGTVSGDDGRPVAGARVEAVWAWHNGPTVVQTAMGRSDRAGRFVLHGVDPKAELTIYAWDGFAASPALKFQPDPLQPKREIALQLNPKFAAPLGGKVVAADGRPIAGARVMLRRHLRDEMGGGYILDDVVAANGDEGPFELRTDADGRFRTRRRFPTHYVYDAVACATGRIAARAIIAGPLQPEQKPAEIILPRLRAVSGTVVDRGGHPIAGARVFQSGDGPMPTETTSAQDGTFQLPGVLEGPALVFAQKDGFRRAFVSCSDGQGDGGKENVPGSTPLKIVLARNDEPPVVAYKTLPPALPIDEERALARRLLEPMIARSMAGKEADRYQIFRQAAIIDPLGMFRRLKEFLFDQRGRLADGAREFVLYELAANHWKTAAEWLEREPSPDIRARCFIAICERHPELPRDQARTFLERAEEDARRMRDANSRPGIEARIAGRWLDLGEGRRARSLLDEAVRQCKPERAARSPLVLFSLRDVIGTLAPIDPPAARKLLDQVERSGDPATNPSFGRYLLESQATIALRLAPEKPAVAEAMLERARLETGIYPFITVICGAMALKDADRARRLAEKWTTIDAPNARPLALALMARSLAEGGPDQKALAIRRLDEAFALLERHVEQDTPIRSRADPSAAEIGAALLPIVERTMPDRLAEYLARVLAMRPRRGAGLSGPGGAPLGPARMAGALPALLARYDRGLAARTLEIEERAFLDRVFPSNLSIAHLFPMAARALIDPRRAVALVEAQPEPPAPGARPQMINDHVRYEVAHALALHGAARWSFVRERFLRLWEPGPLGL